MTFAQICSIFEAQGTGERCKARCPAHDDKKESLTISRGKDGKTLVHCHAGCDAGNVLAAKGLTVSDLFDGGSAKPVEKWKGYVESTMTKKYGKEMKIEAVYDYRWMESGEYAFTKLRMTGKEMVYGCLRDGRFSMGLGGKSRKELPPAIFTKSVTDIREAASRGERIFYAEGEKDILTLQRHGYLAVTAGGASDWDGRLAELLRGAEVVICADNDEAGKKLAYQVRNDLTGIARVASVVVPTPDLEKGDITDFFESGKSKGDLERLILEQFHTKNDKGVVTGVYDWRIYRYLMQREKIKVLGDTPYIYSHGIYEADKLGTRLKSMIRSLIYPGFIKAGTLKRVYDLFLSADELQVRFEDFNAFPESWICFRNGMLDPMSGELHPHDPKYMAINQIPHDYHPGEKLEGEAMEGWLQEVFPEADDRETLLQYIGLCMTRDTRQQKFLILTGQGGTGKSGLIGLVVSIVGDENCSHVPLEKLSERFTSFELMGKLVNSCADLKVTALEDVSVLKQLLGEDAMRGEDKGKTAVNFRNYSKLLFSINELPTVTSERTNGFFRRLLVLTMNKLPEKVDVTLFGRLHRELPYLIDLAVKALGRMYAAGTIAESESSKETVDRMRRDSDSVEEWLEDKMYRVRGSRIERTHLHNLYETYCEEQDRKPLQRNGFFRALRSKGFAEVKSHGIMTFIGLSEFQPDADLGQMTEKNCPQKLPPLSDCVEVGSVDDLPF